jgi:hypothetical protein
MNTNRIIDNDPLEDIDNDDDMLFTNNFVSSVSLYETSDAQKNDFKRYYEDKQRKIKNKKIIDILDEKDIYEEFSSVKFQNKPEVVNKKSNNIIKTEKPSIISIDSSNRNTNKYKDANSFKIDLGKSFYNIKSVRLVSSSIPNTDQVIKDTPLPIRNNLISWQNLEDMYIGIYSDCDCQTIVPDTVDITIPDHGIASQEYIEPLTIQISNSTTTPSIDGKWKITVIDNDTVRIPFYGGVSVQGIAKVDTGFPTYTVAITPGNYSILTISEEAQRKMNLVKRLKGTGTFHYFTVEPNLDTDIVTVRSYVTKELEIDPISTELSSTEITVQSEQHGFKDGDFVLMIGLTSTGGLSSNILNGLFTVKDATRSSFKYEVNQKATFAADGGGNSVKTGKPSEFRFLFDTAETRIVYNIGFPDEDSGVFMNTESTTPLSIYTKSVSSVDSIGDYIEFTSTGHGLRECTTIQINSVTIGENPTVILDSIHNLNGIERVFIYYPHSTPKLMGFYEVTVDGYSSFSISTVTVSSPGSGLGEVKIGGDSIKLLNFKSIPTITGREFPVENVTTDTFQIHVTEGLISLVDSVEDTVVQTNNMYVNHPNHGFNELVGIYNLPFLQVAWNEYSVSNSSSSFLLAVNGMLISVGTFGSHFDEKTIQTSTDGITWTNRNGPTNLATICWSEELSLYVGAGDFNIWTSTDLDTWTLRYTYVAFYTNCTWASGLGLFIVTDSAVGGGIVKSSDGITWVQTGVFSSQGFYGVAYSEQLPGIVVVGNLEIAFSADGVTWQTISLPSLVLRGVVWSPALEIFCAVAYFNNTDINKSAITSPDGVNWTLQTTPGTFWEDLVWSSDLRIFLATGSPGSGQSIMTSRDGITWIPKDYTPYRSIRSLCWFPDLSKFIAGTDNDSYLHSNITYGDIYCITKSPHTYTGTRYGDEDFDAYTLVADNVDIDVTDHGLQTNDRILVTDSTTTPSINGSYFVEVVDSGTVRIPFTITSPGTCKVRKGDSIIFTGTNSIPRIDGTEATVIGIDENDPTYLEISIGVTLTSSGTAGIIGRRNIVSMHRVEPSEPGGDYFTGIPLEIINNTYHQIHEILDENNYMIKLGDFAVQTYTGGGSGITVSSERNGPRVFQSNTFDFEETGVVFRAIYLSGEDYIFLSSPGLDTVYNPGNKKVNDIFAKILLKEQPGALVFDSFISAPKIFNPPLAIIKEMEFQVLRKDGYGFNFNNMNYSVSLEIIEIVDQIQETGLSGRTGTSDLY